MIKIYFEMFQWQLNFVMMPFFDIISWCNNTRALLVVGSFRSRKWAHAFHWVCSFSESKRTNYYERMPVLRSAEYVKKWYLNKILLPLKNLSINFEHLKKIDNCYSPFVWNYVKSCLIYSTLCGHIFHQNREMVGKWIFLKM